jgi:hypothetical protein
MKKYLLFLLALQVSVNCIGQTPRPGQLRISIESFKCLNKSWDGFVEFDGHGNEVFINYAYRIINPATPAAVKSGAGFTPVFGSTGNSRIKAGTASSIGGIDNNNEVAVNILVLDHHVGADDIIYFSPSLWEWDNDNNNNLTLFNRQLADDLNFVMLQPYPFLNAAIRSNDPFEGRFIKIGDKYRNYWPIIKYNFLTSVVNVQENRPVGLTAGPFNGENLALYNPAILFLDTRALVAFHSHNRSAIENANSTHPERPRIISGITETVLTENTYAITTSNGSYSLKLKIEFTPDKEPTPPPTPKYTKQPKQPVINSLPNANINTVVVNVIGKWVGTFGGGDRHDTDFYSFRLNADGSMQVLDKMGNVIGEGNYSRSNFVVSGTYKYLENGSTFSFSGTVNNNTMRGTWGGGPNVSGGGNWIMSKN